WPSIPPFSVGASAGGCANSPWTNFAAGARPARRSAPVAMPPMRPPAPSTPPRVSHARCRPCISSGCSDLRADPVAPVPSQFRGDDARVEPAHPELAVEALILDLRTAVHHHGDAPCLRPRCRRLVHDADLHPDRL